MPIKKIRMVPTNLDRMIALASEVFEVNKDPQQLNVNEKVMEQLRGLHPATLSEYNPGDGPLIWVLLIPTTIELMNLFLEKKISETALLDQTPIGEKYEALYLCSALTLPEYRNKGLTKKLAMDAIDLIRSTHPIQVLFVWNFTKEGAALAKSISKQQGLPLLMRPD